MINRDFTDQYLRNFDSLSEAIYLCWYNSYCNKTNQLDEEKLRIQIRSYGFYPFKNVIRKELPLSFRAKLKFKTLTWVNNYTDSIAEESVCESSELYMQTITEIEDNLLILKTRERIIPYANMLLHYLDKSNVHNQEVEESELNYRVKELFRYILDHNFITEDNVTCQSNVCAKVYPIYDLTVRLINHLDFVERLINAFIFFDISLERLAKQSRCNLFIFNDFKYDIETKVDAEGNVLPKFDSPHTDECLIKIMHHLSHKSKIINPNSDIWLFWFGRKSLKNPEFLLWNGSPTLLSNVIQHLCGNCISNTIKIAFETDIFVKPTWKIYQSSKMYKEIEQIITISKKKNV
ncbi:MAG: hypothetical protein WCK78_01675 [Paludibacter sp.]